MNSIQKNVFATAALGLLFGMPMAAEAAPLDKIMRGLSRANSVYQILRDEDGNEIPRGQILSKAELAACMNKSVRMDVESEDILKEGEYLISAQNEIDAKGEYLEQLENEMDIESQDDIDTYNRHADAFNAFLEIFDARYEAYSTRVVANGEAVDEYNFGCASKYYYEEDEAELLAEAAE